MNLLQKITIYICLFIALISLGDFVFSNSSIKDIITEKKTSYESYNNAGGNSHVSKSIHSQKFEFNCSDAFFELSSVSDSLNLKVSPIFNKINRYTNLQKQYSETYSLRYVTGLIIPVLGLLILMLSFKFKEKMTIIVFVAQIALLSNFIYLLFP